MRAPWIALALGACNGGGSSDPTVTEFVDEGRVCIGSDGGLVIDWEQCLSSSCDTLAEATCEATLDGDTLTVTSYGRIESDTSVDGCTADCGMAMASCALPTIADPSAITLVHGTFSEILDDIPPCAV